MGAEDAAALKALSREVSEAQAALAPLERGAAGLRARAGALEKAIEDAGGAPMKKQRAKVETLKEARACSATCAVFPDAAHSDRVTKGYLRIWHLRAGQAKGHGHASRLVLSRR